MSAPHRRVSSEALQEATGRGWDGWLTALDAAGAASWSHQQIVAHLAEAYPGLTTWWQQTLTVEYERARGRRVVGQTAGVGFQIGVQRRVAAPRRQVWELLLARPDLWLGEGATVEFVPGTTWKVEPGGADPVVAGEIRVVTPADRLRMTWQPEGWDAPATLQLALTTAPSGKTVITAHMEKLADAEVREEMRALWRQRLGAILDAVDPS